jgi:hypothetical protein
MSNLRPVLALIGLASVLGCHVSRPSTQNPVPRPSPIKYPPTPGTYPTGDAEDVYRAALDVLYGTGVGSPPVVVLSELVAAQAIDCRPRCLPFGKHGWKIPLQTLGDLTEHSDAPIRARPNLKYHIPIVLLPIEPERELSPEETTAKSKKFSFQGSVWYEHPFWTEFVQRYPGAWGLARLSAVGFDPQHVEAAVQVAHRCGTYCGSTELMYFRKEAGRWRLLERAAYDEQATDLVISTLRYRGPNARAPRWIEAVRDSVKKEHAGRSVSGVLTDSVTGQPVIGAAVLYHAFAEKPYSPRYWGSTSSDSNGRYRFDNPPPGGFLLVLECPSKTDRAGFLLTFNGGDLSRLSHEVLNFSLNTERCRRPTYPPVPRTSAIGASGNDPSADTSAVYRTVLDAVYPIRKKEESRIVLSEVTASGCTHVIACNPASLDSLRTIKGIDSSTIANFREGNSQASLIALDVGYRGDIARLPAGELEFLEEQAAIYEGPLRFAVDYADRPLWRMVTKAYPDARGLVSLSRVGFDSGNTEALVESTHMEKRGGGNELFLLRKQNGTWILIARL